MTKKKKAVKKKAVQKARAAPKPVPAKKQSSNPMGVFFFFLMTFIVIGLVFAQLFLQDKSFNINLGKYDVELTFPPNSILYLSIFFVVVVILVLIRHAHKSSKSKKEKAIEKKAEPKRIVKKAEAKKVSAKTVKKQQNPGTLYFGLFLFSFALFLGAIFLNNLPAMILALVLMALSLFGYQQLKKSGLISAKANPGKKEKSAKQKKPGFDFFKKQKEAAAKEAKKLPKIELGKYETYLDTLYKIVEQKGKIKLSVLALYFGLDKKKIERWATILEDHKMLTIYYPLIGDLELRKIEPKEPEKNQAEEKL